MAGTLLLQGGAEFRGQMAQVDNAALHVLSEKRVRVGVLPTAAAFDNNHKRAGENGIRWFRSLGVDDAYLINVIDRKSAEDKENARKIEESDILFILGGSPFFLAKTLNASRCAQAIRHNYDAGKIITGSSAGAMILCQSFFNPSENSLCEGLGLLKKVVVIPHHHTFKEKWMSFLQEFRTQGSTIVGIEEETGMLGRAGENIWHVYGKDRVTVYRVDGTVETVQSGHSFSL